MNLQEFKRITRFPFLYTSLPTVILGIIMSANITSINIINAILTVMGIVFIHFGMNMINDYYDWKSGNDEAPKSSPYSGGSKSIQEGLITPQETRKWALAFFATGILIGAYLTFTTHTNLVLIIGAGLFLAYFYTAEPIKYGYRGLGELGIILGWTVLLLGSYYVQTQTITLASIIAGTISGILMGAVLMINEFTDLKADKAVGKQNLVVKLGKEAASKIYAGLIITAYTIIISAILVEIFPFHLMLALLTLPISLNSINSLITESEDIVKIQSQTIQIMTKTSTLMIIGYLAFFII